MLSNENHYHDRARAIVQMPDYDHQIPDRILQAIKSIPSTRMMPLQRYPFPSGQHVSTLGYPLEDPIIRDVHEVVESFKGIENVLILANVIGYPQDHSRLDRIQTHLMEIGDVLRGEKEGKYPVQYLEKESNIFHLLTLIDARQDDISEWYRPGTEDEDAEIVFFGEANYARIFARLLKNMAFSDGVATMDLHSRRAAKWFEEFDLPYVNISAVGKFADWLDTYGYTKDDPDTIIASCDYGDLTRALELHQRTGIPIAALIHKYREDQQISANLDLGNVEGKKVIIWDDMISSAGTLKRDVDLLFESGADEVVFMATHPVFVGKYKENIEYLKEKYGDKIKIVTTNSLTIPRDLPEGYVEVIDITEMIKQTASMLLFSKDFEEVKKQLNDLGYVHNLLSPDEALEEILKELQVYHQ